MTTNEQHLRNAAKAIVDADVVTAQLMDDVEACVTLIRHERMTAGNCQHVSTSLLSYGPPDFEPVLAEDGERVRFCLDCHKASDDEGQA